MDIDWVVASAAFFILVGWAFGYYMGFFDFGQDALASQHQLISSEILSFLTVDGFEVPVYYNSSAAGSDKLLYLSHNWPGGNRSTARILSGGKALDCRMSGDELYWLADVSEGENSFTLLYEEEGPISCTGSFGLSGANLTSPGAAIRTGVLSPLRIGQMDSMPYTEFRRTVNSARDFRVVIETGTSTDSYGPSQPPARETYVDEYWVREGLNREPAKVSVYVW
jgi:hypothetical protein